MAYLVNRGHGEEKVRSTFTKMEKRLEGSRNQS